jgi:hypothetical protein
MVSGMARALGAAAAIAAGMLAQAPRSRGSEVREGSDLPYPVKDHAEKEPAGIDP